MPKEIPILFQTAMVQATDAGRKTQTRRLIKGLDGASVRASVFFKSGWEDNHGNELNHRFGDKGDLLWVRETWRMLDGKCIYLANHWNSDTTRWKPSIHMKKVHARIWLNNLGVAVERVQEISDEDCKREGVVYDSGSGYYFVPGTEIIADSYYEGFQKLWIQVNGWESWERNPWVWVVNYEKI